MADDDKPDLIRAAGGLLWKYVGREWRLAVVHRRRRGDEWTLPKGKLKENESFLEAAKREVAEETGCKVELRAFRTTLWYPVNGVPKLVLLWDMRLVKEGKFETSDEVDAVDWWPPSRAREKLVHARERAIIPDGPELSVGPVSIPTANGAAHDPRLAEAISCYAVELEALIASSRERGDDPWIWANTAREHLHLASQSLAAPEGALDLGWLHFSAAQRWALHGLSEPELAVKERALIEEANQELGSWRKQLVVRSLEPSNGAASTEARRAAIFHAAQARDEHRDHQNRRRQAMRGQITILGTVVIVAIAAIALLTALGIEARDLPLAMLFGVVGGAISGMRSQARASEVEAQEWRLTLTRVAIGAAAGLVVYTATRANVLLSTAPSSAAVCTIAFVAGFSESVVLRQLVRARDR